MTLSQRTILIIVSTFIALLFILAVTSDIILLKSFAALERTVVSDNIQKVRNEIEESYDELLATSHEFGTIIYSHGYLSTNKLHGASLQNHHVDLVICFSQSKQVMASLFADDDARKHSVESTRIFTQLGEIVPLAQNNSGESLHGLIVLEGRPLQLVLSPLPGSDLLLMVGRYLDGDEVNRITSLTEFVLDLVPVSNGKNAPDITAALAAFSRGDENPVQVINQDTIAGYTLFTDFFDRPALIAKISEERILYEQGKATIMYVLSSLFIAGGVFCFVMLFFIRGTILDRLASLTRNVSSVATQHNFTARLPVSENPDELRDLAVSINGMLDSLENADTGLRESEGRYRMLFEQAPDAIVIIGLEGDETGRIVSANQAAADLHGYTLDELLGLCIYDLNSSETNKTAEEMMATIAAGEWMTAEVWHRKKDGTQFPIEIHAGQIKIGGKDYILGFDRDITQRKITEEADHMYVEQIRQLNDELSRKAIDLAAANNELETFNYSVSHDMRGPLTRISGYCQLLLDEDMNLEPDIREYISRIYESETWLNEMIDALLHLAQVTRTEIVSDRVDLSAIAEATLKELSLQHPDRSVTTRIEPDIVVAGDSRLLKMVMINLLDNAWKYSALKNDALIEFGVNRTGSDPIFYVRDNGAGFDMKDAGKLFRVFSRLHDSRQFTGTGIGLATVQRIIFRHGGRIWVEAEAGIGATFFFTLP
ncbi:MAG: PAS domain S-box protein [Geobacteraceae bacterium]|nr:PAS domain S-box protein [Geobacteraceae bacterium]